jgi:hypothetical protein
MKFIKDILTGIDNATYDIAKVVCVPAFFTFFGLEIYQVLEKGIVFDMQQFGIAFGLMISALGAALKLKETSEPKPPEPPK